MIDRRRLDDRWQQFSLPNLLTVDEEFTDHVVIRNIKYDKEFDFKPIHIILDKFVKTIPHIMNNLPKTESQSTSYSYQTYSTLRPVFSYCWSYTVPQEFLLQRFHSAIVPRDAPNRSDFWEELPAYCHPVVELWIRRRIKEIISNEKE